MINLLWLTAAEAAPRQNIVLIFSDDHARQAISAYGSGLIQTPAIDRLAREGVRFDRFYTTNPICGPSRATLFTGKYSHLNGFKDNSSTFDGSQQTFPKLLQAAGYKTGVVGKWHLVSEPTGFDDWEILPGQGNYYNPDFLTPKGRVTEQGYVTEIITKKALAWMDQRGKEPFFLMIGHKAPHRTWEPGPKQMSLFNDRIYPEPATLRTNYAGLTSEAAKVHMRIGDHMRQAEDLLVDYVPPRLNVAQKAAWTDAWAPQDRAFKAQLEAGDRTGTNYQRYVRNYLRCIAGVDESVGEVMDYLAAKDLLKNTVVIYASDQGFFLGENGWFDKRWFYEPSAGTPLIVRPAGGAAKPRVVKSLASNVDLAPTILQMANVKVPKDLQGHSLVPNLTGKKVKNYDGTVYGHFYESNDGDHNAPQYCSLTTERYKLIYYYESGGWELFDLVRDPNETNNLYGTPAGAVGADLLRKLQAKMRAVKEDPGMIPVVTSGG